MGAPLYGRKKGRTVRIATRQNTGVWRLLQTSAQSVGTDQGAVLWTLAQIPHKGGKERERARYKNLDMRKRRGHLRHASQKRGLGARARPANKKAACGIRC